MSPKPSDPIETTLELVMEILLEEDCSPAEAGTLHALSTILSLLASMRADIRDLREQINTLDAMRLESS